MPAKRWLQVLEVFAVKALAGDRWALRFFADYMLGKPIERVVTKTERDANLDRYFSTLADAVRDADHGSSDADTDN